MYNSKYGSNKTYLIWTVGKNYNIHYLYLERTVQK